MEPISKLRLLRGQKLGASELHRDGQQLGVYCRIDAAEHCLPQRGSNDGRAVAAHEHQCVSTERRSERLTKRAAGDQHVCHPVLLLNVEYWCALVEKPAHVI